MSDSSDISALCVSSDMSDSEYPDVGGPVIYSSKISDSRGSSYGSDSIETYDMYVLMRD